MKLHTEHLHEALGHGASDKRLDILRRIGEAGSISQAARDAGVSYKAAWQAVDTLSNLAGSPLLEKAVGGSGGGGARLTEAGHQLLAAAQRLQSARSAVVAQLDASKRMQVTALALRTSMRNTLPCSVTGLTTSAGAVNVQLALEGGQTLVSRITRESAQLLGLTRGLKVLALCKATAVTVRVPDPDPVAANVNRLHGQVTRLPAAGRAGEIALQIGDGLRLVGFADANHGLRKGAAAQALLETSAVVVGLV